MSSSVQPKKRRHPVSATTGVLANLISISLVVFFYERALIPLYGSGPTTYLLHKVVLASVFVAVIKPIRFSATRIWLSAALCFSFAPNATYWVAVLTARRRIPVLGPAITHFAVLAPLTFILTLLVLNSLIRRPRHKNELRSTITYRVVAAGLCSAAGLSQRLWSRISLLNSISESQMFLGLAGVMWSVWILRHTLSWTLRGFSTTNQVKSILLVAFIALWWSTHHHLSSPVLPHPLKETYTHPKVPLQIHSSVQSVTGLIVVGEALPSLNGSSEGNHSIHSLRYLRASHSLLGGVWMGNRVMTLDDQPPTLDSFGTALGDSVYGVFSMQEAARLVDSTEQGKAGLMNNALIIGLGIGTSATAFLRHGLSTTIVEIDPAVYDAARTYFGLPDPGIGKVFLEDARQWAASERRNKRTELYDIVIHDCFSGGGLPAHIFTLEFWEDLKSVIHPEGIVVVNVAGILRSDSTRMVLSTLEKSFNQCRAFHDHFGDMTDAKYDAEFMNIVFFCTSSKPPLTFRRAQMADYLGSPLRRHVLDSLPTQEIKLDLIRDPLDDIHDSRYILTDADNPLGRLQEEQGRFHWTLMRQVLPDVHWETY